MTRLHACQHPRFTFIWLLCLLCSTQAVAAGLEARLDRTRVAEGETVVLIVNVPGDSGGTPDLSALAQDFDILNQSQSMHMSMINGRSSSSRGWQFVLAPRRTGTLKVPAIRVGAAATKPLALEVLPAAQAARIGPAAPVLLEVDAEPKRPYVQQKTIYTVRMLSRAPLRQARISEPRIADAIVEPLGPETEYATQRDGQQYRVSERRYAVFPQRSGELRIEGPVLSAELPEQNPRGNGPGQMFRGRDPFADFDRLFGRGGFPGPGSAFQQTRPIQLRAQQLTLEVQPQPAGTASPWLPAESLSLNETWSSNPPEFRVGEPITRTVAITAQGLSAAQLPELALEAGSGIKAYPDKSQVQARVDGNTLVAQKVLRAALIPSQSGRLTLPPIRLAWWDTQSNQQRLAELPAREVEVLPAPAGATPPAGAAVGQTAAAAAEPAAAVDAGIDPDRDAVASDTGGGSAVRGYWPWIAALLGLAWLVTVVLWVQASRANARRTSVEPAPGGAAPRRAFDQGDALAGVEQACRSGDAGSARRALLDWGAARWPDDPPRRLDTLARRLGDDAEAVLAQIDAQLYADASAPWDGIGAWSRLSSVLARQARPQAGVKRDSALPPLYPQGV